MKSHMGLLRSLLDELGRKCCTSTTRDFEYITRRVENEKLSFMTIALPNFCKDFERSLSRGFVDSTVFDGYVKTGCLPRFLSGFTSQIFDRTSGTLLDAPDHGCIFAVRQITLLCGKMNLPCSDARVDRALDGYIECEQEVSRADALRSYAEIEAFRSASVLMFRDILIEMDRKVYYSEVVPKHGPGTTEDGTRGNAKYRHLTWTDRLEEYLLCGEFLFPSWRHYDADSVDFLDPGSEIPVRVITVPKTLKTPRIIAVEPVWMQFVQQAVLEPLVSLLESNYLVKDFIGFTKQEPNQVLAREGSLNGELATLDLSEASDRVSNQLVLELLGSVPTFSGLVQACRSTHADVPDRGIIPLVKFASMGSALCFPIEAMVFLTVVMMGIAKSENVPLTRKFLAKHRGQVRVYGDDLIVPVDSVQSVIESLETYGFKVNSNKSFWTGKFRESCGKEYYDGTDVSIVRLRRELPASRTDVSELISAVSMGNQLTQLGLVDTAEYVFGLVERFIPLPKVLDTSPVLGRHVSSIHDLDVTSMCPNLQNPLVRGAKVVEKLPSDPLEGYFALLKFFLKRSDLPIAEGHLERSGRPLAVTLKLGLWSAV